MRSSSPARSSCWDSRAKSGKHTKGFQKPQLEITECSAAGASTGKPGALRDAFPNPGASIAVSSRWRTLTLINDSVQPWEGGEQEEGGFRAEQMGYPAVVGFEFGVPGGSTGNGDWPQTRTQVLVVFPEPHLKFGHTLDNGTVCE